MQFTGGLMYRHVDGANRRILIIDDNPAIHDDFRKILGAGLASAAALSESEAHCSATWRRRRYRSSFKSTARRRDKRASV